MIIQERDRRLLLKYLCDKRRTATLLVQERDLQTRFSSADPGILTFDLLSEPPSLELQGSSCICLFTIRERTHAFVVVARKVLLCDDRLPQIETRIPSKIFISESRKSFRIPLDEDTPLRFILGGYGPAKPLNISIDGILVELPDDNIDLPVGSPVNVELSLNSKQLTLEGKVRRRQGSRMALSFEHLLAREPTPPAVLVEIVESLEENWTQTRFQELCLNFRPTGNSNPFALARR